MSSKGAEGRGRNTTSWPLLARPQRHARWRSPSFEPPFPPPPPTAVAAPPPPYAARGSKGKLASGDMRSREAESSCEGKGGEEKRRRRKREEKKNELEKKRAKVKKKGRTRAEASSQISTCSLFPRFLSLDLSCLSFSPPRHSPGRRARFLPITGPCFEMTNLIARTPLVRSLPSRARDLSLELSPASSLASCLSLLLPPPPSLFAGASSKRQAGRPANSSLIECRHERAPTRENETENKKPERDTKNLWLRAPRVPLFLLFFTH
jgi:hypothetical protein